MRPDLVPKSRSYPPRCVATFGLLLVVATLSAGCDRLPFGYTPIADIVQKSGSFEGKTVKVKGTVTNVVQLPFAELRYYTLRQGDAEVVVFTHDNVPGMGEQISVVGTVTSVAIVGATSIGLHITEQRHW